MSKKEKTFRPKARVPKGLRDMPAALVRAEQGMIARIREVYERYGFDPLETSAFEYADALGKFLPDEDRPNEGVFSFQDDDEQWLSLRYDLTASLARYVAENYDALPKPFRRYQTGPVWRNEKPGPGRFRQFYQCDADTVGSASPFIGLFGTVWGIKNAFEDIAMAQNTNLAVVAPGIAEALLATGLGLLAAIPAVIFYNKLSADSDRLVAGYEALADEFSTILSRHLDAA